MKMNLKNNNLYTGGDFFWVAPVRIFWMYILKEKLQAKNY